jgi:DNA polymerase I-like protein with 3'-5' exonuclease and polymerase domains
MDYQTGQMKHFLDPHNEVKEIQEWLNQYEEVMGHNFIGFDAMVLRDLLGITLDSQTITDTIVLSKLYNPSLEDGHSLGAWGDRLKSPKGDHNDWTKLTPEMVSYCEQDLRVTAKLYDTLMERLEEFGDESVLLEHKVQTIVTKQIENGWSLDQGSAWTLIARLKEKKMELEDEVRAKFVPLPKFVSDIVPKYNKDGKLSVRGIKFLGDSYTKVWGNFSRISYPEFNLGSRQQISKHLQYFGWKPTTFTEKGQAIVDESVLVKVTDIPEAQLIAEFLLVQKRIAQVTSWVDAVEEDGRVHGNVNSLGAVTGRMTHSSPNMAQVPASYSPYGHECRSCWTVPKGKKLVGIDASGLELRMLAHYMNDEEYTNEVINGDIHTANQKAAGLDSRDTAKTFIYAFLYGAGDAKIGSIVGGSSRDGSRLKSKFLKNTPSLNNLRTRVTQATERGYIKGIDNRKIRIRNGYSGLNFLLQSAGAIIMKKALTILDEYATIYKIDYKIVGNIHDEFQVEVEEDKAKKFGWLAVECIKDAGLKLNLRCPLDGEYKIGDTWAETH